MDRLQKSSFFVLLLIKILFICVTPANNSKNIRIPISLSNHQMKILEDILAGSTSPHTITMSEAGSELPSGVTPVNINYYPTGQPGHAHLTKKGKSGGSYGATCSRHMPCNINQEPGLVCIDNLCECENSMTYTTMSPPCISKIGGSCYKSKHCVSNAFCTPSGRCQCKTGYIEDEEGYCFLGYDMPCEGQDCNAAIPLVCRNNRCACRDPAMIYDQHRKSCVGLVGAKCSPQRFSGPLCVSGAVCEQFNKNLPGRCVCPSYKIEVANRTCSIDPHYTEH